MSDITTLLTTLFFTVIIFLVVFLAIRALNVWYWKIDERIGLLKNIADCELIQAEQSVKQTQLLNVMAAHQLKDSKIGLTNKLTGAYKTIAYEELQQYNVKEFDITVIT